MPRHKNIPKTKDTARKSTTPRFQPNPNSQRRTRGDSAEMFARTETRLREQVINSTAQYSGPVGLGIGKGGIRRIRRVMPKRRDIERSSMFRNNSIPLTSFARVIKGILRTKFQTSIRFQVAAIEAMREAVEAFAVEMFETSNMFVQHARRVTVMCRDIALFKRVKERPALKKSNGTHSQD